MLQQKTEMSTQNQTIQAIAARHLRVQTLATQKSDSLDFHELAVWSIEAGLNAAYEAGKQQACSSCKGGVK